MYFLFWIGLWVFVTFSILSAIPDLMRKEILDCNKELTSEPTIMGRCLETFEVGSVAQSDISGISLVINNLNH